MDVMIIPSKLKGSIKATPSKSHAHRILIADALADGHSEIVMDSTSDDIETTRECLSRLDDPHPIFDCHESGSTLRFLLPLAAVLKSKATFIGQGRLPERPLSPLKEEMIAHGCTFSREGINEICTVSGPMSGGVFSIPGNVSSQYITGLLFALPLLDEGGIIELTSPLESRGYVDLTIKTLQAFGIRIIENENSYEVPGCQLYKSPEKIETEGDWSNMAFWLAANALGSDIKISGLDIDSPQGDKAITELVKKFDERCTIDAGPVPDLVPILSVIASVSPCASVIENAAKLRLKESDRLRTTYEGLSALGANIIELPAGLQISGTDKLPGGICDGAGDHRIVMAMAIAATVCEEPVTIKGAEAVNKSYPGFFEDYRNLGGEVIEL